MKLEGLITGLQHIGIPASDIEDTCRFYEQFGFRRDCEKKSVKVNKRGLL